MKPTERGSITPLVILFVLVVGGLMMLLAHVTGALMQSSYAQTAADAAALAGASNGRAAADQAAAANHGRIVSYETAGSDTLVLAKVGDITKSARARHEGVKYDLSHGGQ